jgi:hypothetical protein
MRSITSIVILVALCVPTAGLAQIPQTISYQGVLTDGAGTAVADGTYNITFKLYDADGGGSALWTETQAVQVTGGIFSAILGSTTRLDIAFDRPYWLGVSVDGGAELSPRRELTSSPYSLNAQAVVDSAITGGMIKNGTAVRSLNGLTDDVTLAAGDNVTITQSNDSLIVSAAAGTTSTTAWSLTGNAGTTAGTNFIGTNDDEELEIHVNGQRALRIEPQGVTSNIVGGFNNNAVTDGAVGATISGGGGDASTFNQITDNWCVVAGGSNNQAGDGAGTADDSQYAVVGGGFQNTASGAHPVVVGGESNTASWDRSFVGTGFQNQATREGAVIVGGYNNIASGDHASIGGGWYNTASGARALVAGGQAHTSSGHWSTVGGGFNNFATGDKSTVAGGFANHADGVHSTVPGGQQNTADGENSFAAGTRAKVDVAHYGAFVYADSTDVDFNSTAANEFAVRATGGVRLVTAVDGTGDPTAGVTLASGGSSWGTISDRNAKDNFDVVDGEDVLDRLAAIELSTWNYKTQDHSIRHMGPMAQDFYAAFGLGEDEKRINTVDADGVALAAIQGLNLKLKALNEQLQADLEERDKQIRRLERRLARLEALLVDDQVSSAQSSSR